MTGDTAAEPTPTSWRELAVARSLDPARARAEKRVQRFLDAALELMSRSPDKEFTVQEVVERSGQSLRSFYQYFAGKHELLLALFEESVESAAAQLEIVVAAEDDPIERLHAFCVEYNRMCRTNAPGEPVTGRCAVVAVRMRPDRGRRTWPTGSASAQAGLQATSTSIARQQPVGCRGSHMTCSRVCWARLWCSMLAPRALQLVALPMTVTRCQDHERSAIGFHAGGACSADRPDCVGLQAVDAAPRSEP